MPVSVKLGLRPAVQDDRVPFFHDLAAVRALPAAPAGEIDWYAAVGEWGMLGNNRYGCCAEAGAGHATLQFTTYAGVPRVPTTPETLALYSAITGFDPAQPVTDQGTVLLGPGGLMQYWATKGVVFGGARSFAKAFCQLDKSAGLMTQLRQAIWFFGGVLLGIDLPASIVSGSAVPYLWDDPSGPVAGGHLVWVDGVGAATERFDFVSWGGRYRMTAEFLAATIQEAIPVYDPDSLNARGLSGNDFNAAELMAYMAALKAEA